ncbi:MAG: hypothetical protein AVDCRST_MAG72-310 [uncultured Nocardioidaceae bacterium]|uniref:Sulfatase N-terminal domain-containing protein n=1 Tax=uncultured Nocardioidaceae bacterium TaxID=253824 RepID=A0A6J4LF61_9ACTN|nr:MAG: hypothetical protein AVDCRST_MAG72-310 [uncultured Nocardioidaceae bacterium]
MVRIPDLGSSRSPGWVLTGSLLVTMAVATLAHLTLELWQLDSETEVLWARGIGAEPSLFWLSTGVVWLAVVLVLAVVGRLWLTVGIVVAATAALGFAQHEKLQLRLEPIFPSDLAVAMDPAFLRQMIGWGTTLGLLAGLAVVMAVSVLAGRFAERWFPRIRRRTHPRLGHGLLAVRFGTVVLLIAGGFYASDFNTPGNAFRAAYEGSGAKWRSWHQRANYASNGLVAGMLYNTDVPGMVTPPGYSAQTMRSIAQKYDAAAAAINRHRDPHALDDVNVVMALGETFTDPTRLKSIDVAADPIPFTRSLMERTTSGNMLANRFGGGTANAEFSALTGMSLALFQPQLTTPYQMLVPDYDSFPSLVGYFDQLGHQTVAIHPFRPTLYRRSTVYPTFGFDQVKFDEEMRHQERLEDSDLISDRAAFREVEDHIERTDPPVFVNLVSMQNHFPMAGKYDDPVPVAGLADGEAAANAAHYVRGLRYSDEALEGFIGSLERSDEKTVLVYYGDHLPPFWPMSVRAANGTRRMRETPFLVYANFGQQAAQQLPTTSPTHFGGHLLDAAGAPLPPYQVLLRKLENHLPALEHEVIVGPDNTRVLEAELSPRARQLLRDYRLVQYDLSIGQRYVQSEMFYPRQTSVTASD